MGSSPHQFVEEGYASLTDEIPKGLSQVQLSAWVIGYLYAYTQKPCPLEIQVLLDRVLGYVYEVTEEGDAKVGYLVAKHKGRLIPARIYER